MRLVMLAVVASTTIFIGYWVVAILRKNRMDSKIVQRAQQTSLKVVHFRIIQ